MEQTFNASEIFLENLMVNVLNSSLYSIEEVRSPLLGRCYMVCTVNKVSKTIEMLIRIERDVKGDFQFFNG
jgi:hypothetical protein